MRIRFRVVVGGVGSGAGGLPPMTRVPVSPRTAWAFRLPVTAQAAHTTVNARNTDFMVVGETEEITVGELRSGSNAPKLSHFDHDPLRVIVSWQPRLSSHGLPPTRRLQLLRIYFPNAKDQDRN
jgi:hypothetical protein